MISSLYSILENYFSKGARSVIQDYDHALKECSMQLDDCNLRPTCMAIEGHVTTTATTTADVIVVAGVLLMLLLMLRITITDKRMQKKDNDRLNRLIQDNHELQIEIDEMDKSKCTIDRLILQYNRELRIEIDEMDKRMQKKDIELAENKSTIDRLIQVNHELQTEIDEKNIVLTGPEGLVQMSIDMLMTQIELPMPPDIRILEKMIMKS